MKILNAAQIRELDQYTIEKEPVSSIDLMERAAKGFVNAFISKNPESVKEVWVFCGNGNNGGDGLAIARMLAAQKYTVKTLFLSSTKIAPECEMNLKRLQELQTITFIQKEEDIPKIPAKIAIVDALLGSGLNREVSGLYAAVISRINQSGNTVYSVDVPSGLYCDHPSIHTSIVKADYTFTFQLPKLMFFLADNEVYTGEWILIDIGLKMDITTQMFSEYSFTDEKVIRKKIKKRPVFSHKGTFGRVLLLAGSKGMMGAATLSARSVMRSGAGLVCVHTAECGLDVLQISVPEAILSLDSNKEHISDLPELSSYNAVAIGPGIGEHALTAAVVLDLLESATQPLVLDASAINILAAHPEWMTKLPANSILTPHPGEFDRLAGVKFANTWERLNKAKELSKKFQIIIVLKGAYTAVVFPDGNVHFNSTGNAGMATAGSGDVLTGVIVALLAQGYKPEDAAVAGVYAHGFAGDRAAAQRSMASMTASDIVEHLQDFFWVFE